MNPEDAVTFVPLGFAVFMAMNALFVGISIGMELARCLHDK